MGSEFEIGGWVPTSLRDPALGILYSPWLCTACPPPTPVGILYPILLAPLWCGSLRGHLLCAQVSFAPISYPFSRNASFDKRNISSKPILIKLKIDGLLKV